MSKEKTSKEKESLEEKVEKNIKEEEKEAKEYIEKLSQDLEDQKKKTDEYIDSLKRNMAEFDNYKKRMIKEKESLYSTILSDIIAKLLPIVDNFEKAKDVKCQDTKYKEGISMIYNQLIELLEKEGVSKIPDVGEIFDPELHEAVMSVNDETKKEKEIVEVFRTGYKLKEKVVRHSLVKVAN